MKTNLRFTLCIAVAGFLTLVPTELLAHHSGDPKLDRAIEKANSEFIVAMKTGDAATIAAPYTEDASFITINGTCIQGRTEIGKMYRDRLHALVCHAPRKFSRRNSSLTVTSPMNRDMGKSGCSKTANCRSMAAVFSPSGSARPMAIGRF